MIQPEVQAQLNEIAHAYAKRLNDSFLAVFNKPKYRRSGELADSLNFTVQPATAEAPPTIVFNYAEQGFFIGLKNMMWTKQPPYDDMAEWAKLVQFKGPVPGYKNGSSLPPWKAKERQLWAILKSKKKFNTYKRRPWKREAKMGSILAQMNEESAIKTLNEYQRQLADALSGIK